MADVALNITSTERVVDLNVNTTTREVFLNVVNTPVVRELNVNSNVVHNSRYETVLGSGFDFEIEFADIPIVFSALHFYKPTGENVSVAYQYSNKIYISSNINLLNHKVIFN